MKIMDCRGLACPGPVIQAKKALEETGPGHSFAMMVDSVASRENVRRFVQSRGGHVQTEETEPGIFRMTIHARETTSAAEVPEAPVVLLTGDTLGSGDEKLGRILMEGFLETLPEQENVPDKILLMNGGVKLAVMDSPVVKPLQALTDAGCEILVCGTCLDFFSLKEKLVVGVVSNMFDMQAALLAAASIIRP